jgi:type IV pilus assembly protein PilX
MIRQPDNFSRERGASLLMALIALAGLSLAGAAMMRTSETSTVVAGNIGFHEAAVHASDRALESAMTALAGLTDRTANNSGAAYYASVGASPPRVPAASRLSDANGVAVTDASTGNSMRYVIERLCTNAGAAAPANCVMDGSLPLYRISAIVYGPRNTSEMVQSYVTLDGFTPNCAIVVDGFIEISGVTGYPGSSSCVQGNDDVKTNGSMVNGQIAAVYAAGSVDSPGNVTGAGGVVYTGSPVIPIPAFVPNNYRAFADYILKSDGTIQQTNFATSTVTTLGTYASSSNKFNGGWYRESAPSPLARWAIDSSAGGLPDGLYFVEGNVKISTCPKSPWNISIIATGGIEVSAACNFNDFKKNDLTKVPASVDYIFLMAMGDIKLNGSSSTSPVQGMIITNEEIDFSGALEISGNVVARNANDPDPTGLDSWVDFNKVSGTTTITYDPASNPTLWPQVAERMQWRTVKR